MDGQPSRHDVFREWQVHPESGESEDTAVSMVVRSDGKIFEGAKDVAIQADDKIEAAGLAAPDLNSDYALARYLA